MTVFVTDGVGCDLFLWADTSDEALAAAACAGHDLTVTFVQWDAYRLDETQWALAVADGATVTDRWEPARQLAVTEGRTGTVEAIDRARTVRQS